MTSRKIGKGVLLPSLVICFSLLITGTVQAQFDGASLPAGDNQKLMHRAGSTSLIPPSPLTKTYNVGCLRYDRVYNGGTLFEFTTGTAYDQARAELADPSKFGPAGVVDAQFQLLGGIYNITAGNLANTDIFWAGLCSNSAPLSSTEQQVIFDYVCDGGALVVIADVGPNFSFGPNSVAAPFGVAWDSTSWIDNNPTITNPSHPIINGSFGVVYTIGHASEGSIDTLGPYALEIASNLYGSSIAYIPPKALGPKSGPVLFFSDINEFTSNSTPWGAGIDLGDNRVLFRNLFAYIVDVLAGDALSVFPDTIPETGGSAVFSLTAGSLNANRNYFLLGSVSGTSPGITLPGGMAVLPINWDLFTNVVIALANTSFFQNFMGTLDGAGNATATMNIPAVPGAAGTTMFFAYPLAPPWDFASNYVTVTIVP